MGVVGVAEDAGYGGSKRVARTEDVEVQKTSSLSIVVVVVEVKTTSGYVNNV